MIEQMQKMATQKKFTRVKIFLHKDPNPPWILISSEARK